ncbi:hypothetical protein B5S32_g5590 [[Candida] boidinii]|nr:hypothetical protein B5S32_g5590 [[Candida] boidinii]
MQLNIQKIRNLNDSNDSSSSSSSSSKKISISNSISRKLSNSNLFNSSNDITTINTTTNNNDKIRKPSSEHKETRPSKRTLSLASRIHSSSSSSSILLSSSSSSSSSSNKNDTITTQFIRKSVSLANMNNQQSQLPIFNSALKNSDSFIHLTSPSHSTSPSPSPSPSSSSSSYNLRRNNSSKTHITKLKNRLFGIDTRNNSFYSNNSINSNQSHKPYPPLITSFNSSNTTSRITSYSSNIDESLRLNDNESATNSPMTSNSIFSLHNNTLSTPTQTPHRNFHCHCHSHSPFIKQDESVYPPSVPSLPAPSSSSNDLLASPTSPSSIYSTDYINSPLNNNTIFSNNNNNNKNSNKNYKNYSSSASISTCSPFTSPCKQNSYERQSQNNFFQPINSDIDVSQCESKVSKLSLQHKLRKASETIAYNNYNNNNTIRETTDDYYNGLVRNNSTYLKYFQDEILSPQSKSQSQSQNSIKKSNNSFNLNKLISSSSNNRDNNNNNNNNNNTDFLNIVIENDFNSDFLNIEDYEDQLNIVDSNDIKTPLIFQIPEILNLILEFVGIDDESKIPKEIPPIRKNQQLQQVTNNGQRFVSTNSIQSGLSFKSTTQEITSNNNNLFNCLMVNKLWYKVTLEILYQNLHFNNEIKLKNFNNHFNNSYSNNFKIHPKSLVLHKLKDIKQSDIDLISSNLNPMDLKWIEFYICPKILPSIELFNSSKIINNNNNNSITNKLEKLILPGSKLIDDNYLKIISENCLNLKILDIRACELITDSGIYHIGNNCSNLEVLNIGRHSRGELISDYSISSIIRNTNIKTLGLAGCGITNRTLWELAIIKGSQIERLSLNNCWKLNDNGLSKILKFDYLIKLSVLEIRNCLKLNEFKNFVEFKRRQKSKRKINILIECCDYLKKKFKDAELKLDLEISSRIFNDISEWINDDSNNEDLDYSNLIKFNLNNSYNIRNIA